MSCVQVAGAGGQGFDAGEDVLQPRDAVHAGRRHEGGRGVLPESSQGTASMQP